MFRYFATLLAAISLLGRANDVPAAPAPLEPIVLISGASYQQVTEDLAYLGSTIQNDQFPKLVGGLLQAVTGVRELSGLDTKRRWGAVVSTDGVMIAPVAFIPVTNFDALLEALKPRIGAAIKASDGYYTLGQGSKTLVAIQEGDWAFVGQSRDVLARRPDPAALLKRISDKYDLTAHLYIQQIPEVFRTLAIDQVRLALRDSLRPAPGETAGQFAVRKQRMSLQFGGLEKLFAETEQITAGWTLDRSSKRTSLELLVQPIANSSLAARIEGGGNLETTLAGLVDPQTPLSAHVTRQLDAEQIEGALSQVAAYRAAALEKYAPQDDSTPGCEQCREWIEQLFATAEGTIKSGQIDAAVRLTGDRSPLTLVAAARIADGTALRERFENWAEQTQARTTPPQFRLNVAELKGAPIHAWSMPAGRAPAIVDRLFGIDRTLYVAILPEAIWFGVGDQAVAAMQQAASSSPLKVAPAGANIKLGAIVGIAAQSIQNSQVQGMLSLAGLNLRATDDRVTLVMEPQAESYRIRLEAHEGVLRALTLAATIGLAQGVK